MGIKKQTAPSRRWPDFFIVGAAKAGTTKLYGMLRAHPYIYMPPRKEINFFNRGSKIPRYGKPVLSESEYLSYFSKARPRMLIGDANAYYLHKAHALERLARKCPNASIVILLREPVSRAFSQYLMMRDRYGRKDLPEFGDIIRSELALHRKGVVPKPFDFLGGGEYGCWVPKWLERFGSERVGVFMFDDLVRDPRSFAFRVADFLRVDPERFPARAFGAEEYPYAVPRSRLIAKLTKNRLLSYWWIRLRALGFDTSKLRTLWYKKLERPTIDPNDAALLAEYYREDIRLLESALGRSLPELYYR